MTYPLPYQIAKVFHRKDLIRKVFIQKAYM